MYRHVNHLTFLAAVVGTSTVDTRACLFMTWADKALLPVVVLVMLHHARIAIGRFVEESKVCVKTEVVDDRRQR